MDTLLAGMGSGAHTDAVRLVWQALLPSEQSQGPDLTSLQGDENTFTYWICCYASFVFCRLRRRRFAILPWQF